jgi:hypothetical protein
MKAIGRLAIVTLLMMGCNAVTLWAQNIDQEPNDRLAQALTIDFDETVNGNFFGESSLMQDVYKVTMRSPGKMAVTLSRLPGSCSVHVVLSVVRAGSSPTTLPGQVSYSSMQGTNDAQFKTGTCSYRHNTSAMCANSFETVIIETVDPLAAGDIVFVTVRWTPGGSTTVNPREGGFLAGAYCYENGPYYYLDSLIAGPSVWDSRRYGILQEPLAYSLKVSMALSDCIGIGGVLPPLELYAQPSSPCETIIVSTCSPIEIRQTFHARSQDLGKNVALYWLLYWQPAQGQELVFSFVDDDILLQPGVHPLATGYLNSVSIPFNLPAMDLSGLRGGTLTTYLGYTVAGQVFYDCWGMMLD